jgi:hypothetical protein
MFLLSGFCILFFGQVFIHENNFTQLHHKATRCMYVQRMHIRIVQNFVMKTKHECESVLTLLSHLIFRFLVSNPILRALAKSPWSR